jgi:hypothetical protein
MKNIMLVALISLVLLVSSCGQENEIVPIVFNNLSTSETWSFIDKPIELTIDGSGFSSIEVTSNREGTIEIKKVAATVFEISATKAVGAKIFVVLKNDHNELSEIKIVELDFYQHGIINSNTVEGIKVNVDNKAKVLQILGEPDFTNEYSNTSGTIYENLKYLDKGLSFNIQKSLQIVDVIYVFSSNFYYSEGLIKHNYTSYSYFLGYDWMMNSNVTTMTNVISTLGSFYSIVPTSNAESTLRFYDYSTLRIVFGFYSDINTEYEGKPIKEVILY